MEVDPNLVRDAAAAEFDGGGEDMGDGSPLVSPASEIPVGFSLADILDGGGENLNLNSPPNVVVGAEMVADTVPEGRFDGDEDSSSSASEGTKMAIDRHVRKLREAKKAVSSEAEWQQAM